MGRHYYAIDNERVFALFRKIPKVDKVMEWESVKDLSISHSRQVLIAAVRLALESLRAETARGETADECYGENAIVQRISNELGRANRTALRRVINGTGVIIHTNLGRAPLPKSALDEMCGTVSGYCNLEFDLEKGARGSRSHAVEEVFRQITGAESAVVVNNNAAAVLLALSTLAQGREVVVSRGELVEIGGSFRIPDVMSQSGAILKEVGATNRTHPKDYRSAVSGDTALLLKVHTSNFAVVGFTSEVTVGELAEIGRENALPVMVDAGSGNLVDLSDCVKTPVPSVRDYLDAGADVVTFSGDKLLGGPQAGIIVGNKALVDRMKTNPLYRALRVDKMTLAVLHGTLRLYADERQAMRKIPVLRMLSMSEDELRKKARSLARRLRSKLPAGSSVKAVNGFSQVGGGSLPQVELPTTLVAITISGFSPQQLEQRLRSGSTPVVGRISQGEFLLDPRTIGDDEIPTVVAAMSAIAAEQ
ncbi:MAG: L-seryl-tRNA(Sec) selenium transferase [Geobacteraceae bacterium]|nr:L-seryl-tRNA(Sec) selenium transferase [Geobacteraceae bacterium]